MSSLSVKMWERAPDYPVNLDFMPSTRLQAALNPRQRIYSAGIIVGWGQKTTPTDFKLIKKSSYKRTGDLGGRIKRLTGQRLEVKFGSNNPLDQTVVTNSDIDKEIHSIWDVPTSIIREIGTIDKITKPLESKPQLAGVEDIFSFHTAVANRPNYVRNRLNFRGLGNLKIINTHRALKTDILQRNLVFPEVEEDLKRIRSFLVNQSLLTDTKQGYDSLYPIKYDVQKELRKKRFWKDTAIPMELKVKDGVLPHGEMTICKLDARKDKLIVI